jgi:hypothetical protein
MTLIQIVFESVLLAAIIIIVALVLVEERNWNKENGK